MRYRLNFKGFYDTPESLFGYSINEALIILKLNWVLH